MRQRATCGERRRGAILPPPPPPLLFFWRWRMRYRDGIREDLKQNRKRLDL
jgi:hypothetical protein